MGQPSRPGRGSDGWVLFVTSSSEASGAHGPAEFGGQIRGYGGEGDTREQGTPANLALIVNRP